MLPISTRSSFRVSCIWNLSRLDQLPILQDHLIDKLPADNTFPTPIGIIMTVEFIMNHNAIAARAVHLDIFFHSFR